MEYVTLGSTDLVVSRVGLGTWPMGGTRRLGDYGTVDDEEARAAIRRALDLGITLFDTAPTYGGGRAQRLLAAGLGSRRADVVIVDKCGTRWDPEAERWIPDSSYETITSTVEQSLRSLGTDWLDLLLLHVPDPTRSPDEPFRAFEDLRGAGKVRHFGVSVFDEDQLLEYLGHGPIAAQQLSYHMFDRRMERTMLPLCRDNGVGVMSFGTLAHGLLSGTWTKDMRFGANDWRAKGRAFGLELFTEKNLPANLQLVERLRQFAADRGRTVPQLAVAWSLRDELVATALTGVVQPDEIEENAAAAGWRLSEPEIDELDELLAEAQGTSPDAPIYRV
jgi:aryl-alcohol dehydrogenase-like predicted oxidoreductase